MSELFIDFSHYEKQGIDLVLERAPDGQAFVAKFIRRDTGNVLTRVALPFNSVVKDQTRD